MKFHTAIFTEGELLLCMELMDALSLDLYGRLPRHILAPVIIGVYITCRNIFFPDYRLSHFGTFLSMATENPTSRPQIIQHTGKSQRACEVGGLWSSERNVQKCGVELRRNKGISTSKIMCVHNYVCRYTWLLNARTVQHIP